MAWLHRARESVHKTSRPNSPRKHSGIACSRTAAALAALFAVASCTAPPSPGSGQSTTTAPAPSASGAPKPPQTAFPQTGTPQTGAQGPSPSAAKPAKATAALGWGPQQRDADAAAA